MIGSPRGFGERHGWKLFRARAFVEAMAPLQAEVDRLQLQSADGSKVHPKAKLLARTVSLITDEIPRDPNFPIHALGNTLGPTHRHWRRAKFLQRFRLFFRFDSTSRVIVYAWMNDENQLRKAGSRQDPYAVFSRRLMAGNPPDDWAELLADASEAEEVGRQR